MDIKTSFTIEERPQTEVYYSDKGFFCVKQELTGLGENLVILNLDEAEKVQGWLAELIRLHREGIISPCEDTCEDRDEDKDD